MNLIEKWKNRETKKKLREENIRLKTEVDLLHKIPKPPVCTIERNVQRIIAKKGIEIKHNNVPTEIIKDMLCEEMLNEIVPFVDFGFEDGENGCMIYTATLYVATGDRKYEH